MAANILYSTARTATGELIKASDAQKGQPYTCLICQQALLLRKGQLKRPHFAHKALSVNCSPETALHYSFKILLTEKIQKHLDNKVPLEIEWHCQYCSEMHRGNLLKKAVQVKPEYNLGICQPDIVLLDGDGRIKVGIEVVVTHFPEQRVLDYYKLHQIVAVLYVLKTDEDIQRLSSPKLEPDKVDLCLNPKCPNCGEYMSAKHLLIIKGECWKCFAPMKVAAIDGAGGYISPSEFSTSDIKLANEKGANLTSRYSQTVGMRYVANTCRRCQAFIGDHYLFSDYMAVLDYERESLDVGYYCLRCLRPT